MAVVESKFMWLGRDGKIHYIRKDQFNKAIEIANKTVNMGIKAVVITGLSSATGGYVFAAEAGSSVIMEGLSPLIGLITDFAEPVCYGYMVKAGLKLTQGCEEEAKKIAKNASIGFIGVQFIPHAMKFLRELELFV